MEATHEWLVQDAASDILENQLNVLEAQGWEIFQVVPLTGFDHLRYTIIAVRPRVAKGRKG